MHRFVYHTRDSFFHLGRGRRDTLVKEYHVRAVPWRLHPHSPCTSLGLASHRHILGYGTGWPTMLHETSVIETVAACC